MNQARRRLFKTTLISTALLSLPQSLLAASRQPLTIPPLLESRRGKPVLLGMESTQMKLQDNLVDVWGFNGQYLGPTVKVNKGDFVKLTYRNNLPQPVAMNIQGLQVASELLGGTNQPLQTGQSWSPIVPITQSASTCFYHACTLANSAYQVYRGLAGLWIVEDEHSRKAQLPNKYGVNDIPLILQDLALNNAGMQLFRQNEPHFLGDRLFVTGQQTPFLNIERGWIRLRILNASLSRAYELRFDDEREMLLIAQDQGFLPQAQSVKSLWLGMGERAEILVDMNEGSNATLIAGQKRGFIDNLSMFWGSGNELSDNTVLELRPEGSVSAFNNKPQTQFADTVVLPKNIAQTREFELDTANAMINQKHFDPRQIDVYAKLNSTERWVLTSSTPTAFRVQGARFVVESVNGQNTEPSRLVWKDSIRVDGKVQVLIQFNNLSSNTKPFFFGSADLMQVDKGAVGLMVVQ